MGRGLEESLRHTAAVSSAVASHSIARFCTEVPAALKSAANPPTKQHQHHHHQHHQHRHHHDGSSSEISLSSIPELKPAETTLSPGVWSVFAAVSGASELVQATRKFISKLVDEEERVRVAMDQAIGMSKLDAGISKAKRNFAGDALDLDAAARTDPEVVKSRMNQRKRVLDSKSSATLQQRPHEATETPASAAAAAEAAVRLRSLEPGKPIESITTNQQAGTTEGPAAAVSAARVAPKRRPKLFTRQELAELNDDELEQVLASLHTTASTLREKIDDVKTSDQESSAALAKAEILVNERETDLTNAEMSLARENQEYQRQLQSHLEELVESERGNLHNIERHSRHLWRIDDPTLTRSSSSRSNNSNSTNNTRIMNHCKNRAATTTTSTRYDANQKIDVDAFVQRDPRFSFLMDDEELEMMYSGQMMSTKERDNRDDESEAVDDLLSNNSIVDDYYRTLGRQERQIEDSLATAPATRRKLEISPSGRRRKSQIGLASCCRRKKQKINRLVASIAAVEHSLMGVPFAGWSAGVGQQLRIAETSVDAPPSTSEDGLPAGVQWSHIISIDTFEAGSSGSSDRGNTSSTAALVDLLATAEKATLAEWKCLLPPPINSSDRIISKMTGESALYVVGSSVAIPSSEKSNSASGARTSTSASPSGSSSESDGDDDDELFNPRTRRDQTKVRPIRIFKQTMSSDSDDDDEDYHQYKLHQDEVERKLSQMMSCVGGRGTVADKKITKTRYSHGFAGLISHNDTTKIDPTMKHVANTSSQEVLEQGPELEQQSSLYHSSSMRRNDSTSKKQNTAAPSNISSVALAVGDSEGSRRNRFVHLDVKGEVVYQ